MTDGQIGYEAYIKSAQPHQPSAKFFTWDKLPPYMQESWEEAAKAIVNEYKDVIGRG